MALFRQRLPRIESLHDVEPKSFLVRVGLLLPIAIVSCATPARAPSAHPRDFVVAVKTSGPLAYYRIEGPSGVGEVGATAYASHDGAEGATACSPVGHSPKGCVELDGRTGWISTSAKAGVSAAGSLMAWVRLAGLPFAEGHFFYVAGESQLGNDFDLQFETDNSLDFYTQEGSHLHYVPDAALLPHVWHMIVVTVDPQARSRTMYWDGARVTGDIDGRNAPKTATLSIGASLVFPGRFFHGSIAEVALWDRALTADEVSALYDAGRGPS